MSTILSSDFKNKSPKWLFAAVLLLSFFTFSGIALKLQAEQYAQRTTLVANPQTGLVRSISYTGALRRVYNNDSTRLFFAISTFNISRAYSCEVCTCINHLAVAYKYRPKTAFFLLVKNFTQNAGDYPVIHLG